VEPPFESRPLIAAIQAWATARQRGYRLSGAADRLAYLQLHTRPDPQGPEVQLTFRPVIVDGHAMIQVDHPSFARQREPADAPAADAREATEPQRFTHAIPESTPREPEARCEVCGTLGTVGRASRTDSSGSATEMHRFCLTCWPEQSARYRARWAEEDRLWAERFHRGEAPARGAGPGMMFEAATWHATLDLVRTLELRLVAPIAPSKEALAQVARDIEANASRFDGEMPLAVESFIARYRARTDSANITEAD
jgi:hypothetical protein